MAMTLTLKPTSTGGKSAKVRVVTKDTAADAQVPQMVEENQEVTISLDDNVRLEVMSFDNNDPELANYMRDARLPGAKNDA